MTTATDPPAAPTAGRFTPGLLLLFAGSGCAALLYEVVWFHLLRLVVGSSSVSLAFLLGSFMGGMCLGSLLLPKLVGSSRHPLRVYAGLELGIGALGLVLPWALPWLADLYTSHAGSGPVGFVLRGAVCGTALLLPTMLMGATLPAIARWLDDTQPGLARLGWFYGANIAGAVLGTLLAGFWLLPAYDVMVATWVAVAINVAVALVALLLASCHVPAPAAPAIAPGVKVAARPVIYVAIALSGCTALGAEVVWTRLLSLLFGATVYTFTLILAVFLIGLGIGSALGSRLLARSARPARLFGWCQAMLVPCIVYTSVVITYVLPNGTTAWKSEPYIALHWLWDIARCALTILPCTLLWGASFPLALAAAARGNQDPGRLVGGIYAANTIGAIAGSILTGIVFIGGFGTQRTQQLLALAAGMAAVLALAGDILRGATRRGRGRWLLATALLLLAVPALTLLIRPVPKGLLAFGHSIADWKIPERFLYTAEGMNASVAITDIDGRRNFHINGKVEASTEILDMRLQRLLGHLPALLHHEPRSVLIVGCGAGVTAGCFVDHPSIDRIVICELEPKVIIGTREFLAGPNRGVLDDPRTTVMIDDARHFLATTTEKFDIITSDPIHPWVRGAAALYSSEYYDLMKRHLNADGLVTQWVPLYQTDEASVKSQIGTFALAFPSATLWNSDNTGKGYDLVMMAQHGNPSIDTDDVRQRIQSHAPLAEVLGEVDLGTPVKLLLTYAGRASDMGPWLADAQVNRDVSLRLQYLAGLRMDVYREHQIYAAIKGYRRYPVDLFATTPEAEQELRQAFAR